MKPKVMLFVDDDCHMAWAFGSDLLEKVKASALDLRIFTDADEAIRFIDSSDPSDIAYAIIDLWMQDKNTGVDNPDKGQEIVNLLQNKCSSARIAVLSAHMDDKTRRILEKRNVLCFRKPTMSAALFDALLRTTKGH